MSQRQHAARAITIVDQNGRLVPDAPLSATGQIFDVTVGPNGMFVFSPDMANISVGDTVRWTWASNNHSVTSGNSSCSIDFQFCSPNDTECGAGTLSNAGAVYQHTFTQAGTYSYFCVPHCAFGMTGVINVGAACTPPPANMVAWWPGDGSARDIQNARNGTLQGGATFAPGLVDQAFALNGTSSFVQVPDNDAWALGTSPFTIDLWVNFNTFTAHGTLALPDAVLIGTDEGGGNTNKWAFFAANGVLTLHVNGPSGPLWLAQAPFVPTLHQWYHLAITRSGNTFTTYVNGSPLATETNSVAIPNAVASLTMGQIENLGFVDGLIEEVEIFNRALSQTEIAAIANAGAAGKCKPPQPTAAFSRKTHGGAGTFDIDLMPSTTPGIECRSSAGGVYQMIVQFLNPVTVTGATLTGSGSVSGFSVSGGVVTIDLSNIANAQTIVVKLTGVNDGTLSGDVPVAMSVLLGDTNGNGAVSASDIGQTKAQSGQTATGANFRTDVNVSGAISAADIALVKSKSGTALPP